MESARFRTYNRLIVRIKNISYHIFWNGLSEFVNFYCSTSNKAETYISQCFIYEGVLL